MSKKILLVDDERRVLNALSRRLSPSFDLSIASGAKEALVKIRHCGPYAVVCSDMRMPDMSGIQLLEHLRESCPDTVRIMLTGNADQQMAMDAVNRSEVFRILTKPCTHEVLSRVFVLALRQYELVTAENELLCKTLGGAVGLLNEMLAATKPQAQGRATRIAPLVDSICEALKIVDGWQVTLAAMLSQVGCVTVPNAILQKVYLEEQLSKVEREIFSEHPYRGFELVTKIPRMQDIADIIRYQNHSCASTAQGGDTIPFGARVLKVVLDYDVYCQQHGPQEALKLLAQNNGGNYDRDVLRVLSQLQSEESSKLIEVTTKDLVEGMVLGEDVVTLGGDVLVARGSHLSQVTIKRILNYSRSESGVCEPISVRVATKSPVPAESYELGV